MPRHILLKNLRLAVFDFDGVFTDNRVIVSENGSESVICNRSDGLGLRRLREAGVEAFILSMEENPVVTRRARKLKMECHHGIQDKLSLLKREAKRRGTPLSQVAYVGNDINDIECLDAVGVPVVPADAWAEVRPHADWILKRRGGDGAVREFCDAVWKAKTNHSRGGIHG